MAKLWTTAATFALLLAPLSAHADWIVEGSVGSGFRFEPTPVERIPTNVMIAGGLSFPVVKLELGLVGNLTDVEDSKFDLDLRPMLVVKPPLLPIYGRAILGVSGLVEGPAALTYGGAVGVRLGALGVGGFFEAGALSRRIELEGKDQDIWVAEGRLGIYWD